MKRRIGILALLLVVVLCARAAEASKRAGMTKDLAPVGPTKPATKTIHPKS